MRKYGVWTTIDRGRLHESLCKKYQRKPDNLCTKIFDREPSNTLKNYHWGGGWGYDIFDSTRFQNICAFEGLAPRVYALDIVDYEGNKCVAQLCDFISGEEKYDEGVVSKIEKLNDEYGGIRKDNFKDYGRNIIDGKFVDFQIFSIDPIIYKEKVKELIETKFWGFVYQSVPEVGVEAHRDCTDRINDLDLTGINFEGKTVLDIGCSNGVFCNYAARKGARVTGYDLESLIIPARALSNYLGLFNIDYVASDLTKETIDDGYDIVFFFSMVAHIGLPDWLKKTAKELLIFENSGGWLSQLNTDKVNQLLKDMKITKKGKTSDRNRDFYWLIHEK